MGNKNPFSVLFASFVLLNYTQSAHILFFHQISSYSHQVATYPLAEALLEKGHQITYITPWHHKGPQPLHPNITVLVPEKYRQTMSDFLETDFDIKIRVDKLFPRLVHQFYPTAITLCQDLLTSPELEQWTSKTLKVDLLVIDNCMAECSLAIAQKYKTKHVFFDTVANIGSEYDQFGFNPESSTIPELEIDPPQVPMTFKERVVNTLISLHFRWVQYNYLKDIDKLVRTYLKDPELPFIDDIIRNASLVLYTGDVISDYPRSHPPFFVNVGGMHCHQNTNKTLGLPEDLKRFIEDNDGSSSDGFIYISFGSVALASKLPESVRQVFLDTIITFPNLKFLWKWNGPLPENIPENLYLAPWFPQTKILSHPKIKGFITQSGRPSTLEALCNAVPMIAFPVLGDQDVNANRMNQMGGNIKLELAFVTRAELKDAIGKLAYDSRMKERMLELQNILLDQPIPPLEKAVWWVEYVLRHKDTNHLRAAGFDQWWFQRRLLDVWAFLFLIVLAILGSCILVIAYLLKQVSKGKKTKAE